MASMLMAKPLVEIRALVNVEDIVIGFREDRQLRVASSCGHRVNQFLDIPERCKLILGTLKHPQRQLRQLVCPFGSC